MTQFISSRETLERLCETDKPQNARNGAKLLAIGAVTGGMTAGEAYLGWNMSDYINSRAGTAPVIIFGAFMGLCALITGVVTAGAFYDGISSFTRPLMRGKDDGNIYYRNNGFTRKATRSDRFCGSKVVPIESTDDLVKMPICGSYVLLNGVYVKETKVILKNLAMAFDPKTKSLVPDCGHSKVLETNVEGCFYGKDIDILANDAEMAKKLGDVPQGSPLFVFGWYNGHSQLMLAKFGEAL